MQLCLPTLNRYSPSLRFTMSVCSPATGLSIDWNSNRNGKVGPLRFAFERWNRISPGLGLLLSARAAEGHPRGQAAIATAQCKVDGLPVFLRRGAHGTGRHLRPLAGTPSMLLRPVEDLLDRHGRLGGPARLAAILREQT